MSLNKKKFLSDLYEISENLIQDYDNESCYDFCGYSSNVYGLAAYGITTPERALCDRAIVDVLNMYFRETGGSTICNDMLLKFGDIYEYFDQTERMLNNESLLDEYEEDFETSLESRHQDVLLSAVSSLGCDYYLHYISSGDPYDLKPVDATKQAAIELDPLMPFLDDSTYADLMEILTGEISYEAAIIVYQADFIDRVLRYKEKTSKHANMLNAFWSMLIPPTAGALYYPLWWCDVRGKRYFYIHCHSCEYSQCFASMIGLTPVIGLLGYKIFDEVYLNG